MDNVLEILMFVAPYLIAFVATICYAVLFNAPRSTLIHAGVCGALGWMGVTLIPGNVIARAFIGAVIVGSVSIIFAYWKRHPRTIFAVAGIVPLVPGATAYQGMLAFVEQNYALGAALALETLFSALSIAAGLITADLIIRLLKTTIKGIFYADRPYT